MKNWSGIIMVGRALAVAPGVSAGASVEPAAVVQKLQQPTWVERDGVRSPL